MVVFGAILMTACRPVTAPTLTPTPAGLLITAAAQTLMAVQPTNTATDALTTQAGFQETLDNPASPMLTETTVAASETPQQTPSPFPTRTPTLSPTFTQTNSGLPSATLRPTRTPTITPTAYAPGAAIAILQPGPQSRIMTPLRLRAYVRPGGDGRVRIELFGEDGRLLYRKLLVYGADVQSIYVDEQLDFEIPGVAESARLQISTNDIYGRLTTLATQDMVLLNIGEADVAPPGLQEEPVLLRQPRTNQFIQGGSLLVSGLIAPFNDQPLLVELIDRQGKVVGYRQAAVTIDPNGGYTPFTVEIPYEVSRATYVLVTVKVYSNTRISGIIYATAREVLISP